MKQGTYHLRRKPSWFGCQECDWNSNIAFSTDVLEARSWCCCANLALVLVVIQKGSAKNSRVSLKCDSEDFRFVASGCSCVTSKLGERIHRPG